MAKKYLSLQEKFNTAVRQGDLNAIEELLGDGANPAKPCDSEGNTALHIAARQGMIVTLRLLLQEEGVDINARNNKGETALMLAAKGALGTLPAVEELLARGSDITLRDQKGQTALMLADSNQAVGRDVRRALRLAQVEHVQKNPVDVSVETAGEIQVRRKPLTIRPGAR